MIKNNIVLIIVSYDDDKDNNRFGGSTSVCPKTRDMFLFIMSE